MIEEISKLKNAGIYKDIQRSTCAQFKRYNLIYGWNGSGKSTLARVFRCIERGGETNDLPDLEYSFTENSQTYENQNINLFNEKIAVFNSDFVNENIDWNGIINSILFIDESNIENAREYNELKKILYGNEEVKGKIALQNEKKQDLQKKESALEKDLSIIAKKIKSHFQTIDMSDSRYINYDKAKVKKILQEDPINREDFLSGDKFSDAMRLAKGTNKLSNIEFSVSIKKQGQYLALLEKVQSICASTILNCVIEELKGDNELSDWVEKGLSLHKEKARKTCAFCGAPLGEDRISELDTHFNEAYENLMRQIDKMIEEVKGEFQIKLDQLPHENEFYEEYRETIKELKEKYCLVAGEINLKNIKICELLQQKRNMPFKSVALDEYNLEYSSEIIKLKEIIAQIEEVVNENNNITGELDKRKIQAQRKVERHYLSQELTSTSYAAKKKEIARLQSEVERENKKLEKEIEKYEEIEKELSSETLAAAEFNRTLALFLGHEEIQLEFDSKRKGYRVIRNKNQIAHNLSEGEKTAIAFTYFITKLKENGSKIEDYILVIDDPVSSFDSNKIFAAYAYLKAECDCARQLFILTHNYNFCSLVLGWFRTKGKSGGFCTYMVENDFDENGQRCATLSDGEKLLIQSTEYDYVFYTAYKMRGKKMGKAELIFCGNICRKLLESFLSFKFPKQRNNYSNLLDKAFEKKEDTFKKELIYKFTNYYSHSGRINALEELDDDILIGNYKTVLDDVFSIIQELDETHYRAMEERVKEALN